MIAHWLAAACCVLGTSVQAPERSLRSDEGPLDNAAFLPRDESLERLLARADALQASLSARAYSEADARRWAELFDLWHVALRDSAEGASASPTPSDGSAQSAPLFEDLDGTGDPIADRRRDGVETLVLRRIAALDDAARAAWTRSQEPIAQDHWEAARAAPGDLALVERRFPLTRAAALAALAACDLEFEAARPTEAQRWLERAERHARHGHSGDLRLTRAFELRRAWLAAATEPAGPGAPWRGVSRLEAHGAHLLADRVRKQALRPRVDPGLFVRPALAFLDAQHVLVHFGGAEQEESLALYDLEAGLQVARTDLAALLRELNAPVGPLLEPLEPPGWPLGILAVDGAVILTVGRRSGSRGNALICLELAPSVDPQAPPSLRVRWLWHDGRRVHAPEPRERATTPVFSSSEFQPGVALDGEQLIAVVREFDADEQGGEANARATSSAQIRTHVVALDLRSGALRWQRWLGRGQELQRAAGRFFGARSPAASAAPVAVAGGRALISSHTGFSAAIDTLDGRLLWALRTRRRPSATRCWSGAAAWFDAALHAWAVAPADSDHLYWLRADGELDGCGLYRAAPRSVEHAAVLIGASQHEAYVLGALGPNQALLAWNAHTARTLAATYLAPEESFSGEGWSADGRALFATSRGLYLVDLERELYLLDYAPLERAGPSAAEQLPRGGSVYAQHPWACVVGPSGLWVFKAL